MFSLRDFVKKGFLDAIGKMANYQIILNAAGWQEKGVLTESDLSEINDAAVKLQTRLVWVCAQILQAIYPTWAGEFQIF